MNSPRKISCRRCGNSISIPELVHAISFPDDYDNIVALLEGRINTVRCGLCGSPTRLFTELLLVNVNEKSTLISGVEESRRDTYIRAVGIPSDFRIQFFSDQSDLVTAVFTWLNVYMIPKGQALLSGSYKTLSKQEQIDLFTPLFLRVLKSQMEGAISSSFQFEQDFDAKQAKEVEAKLYTLLVSAQLSRLLLESARTHSFLQLPKIISERIPSDCLTPEILDLVAQKCLSHELAKDPETFMKGFRREYLAAVTYAYADHLNPRAMEWAKYLRSVWILGQMEEVELDPQFLLSPEIIKSTTRFQDLWDVSWALTPDLKNFGDALNDVGQMMEKYGFSSEYEALLKSGPLVVSGINQSNAALVEGLVKNLQTAVLKQHAFNKSLADSRTLGQAVASSVGFLLSQTLKDGAITLINQTMEEASKVKDDVAVVAIASYSIEELNKFECYSEARELARRVSDLAAKTDLGFTLAIHFFNEFGNVCRYMHDYDGALQAYDLVSKLIAATPEDEVNPHNQAVLRRNQAIVYRQQRQYGMAIKILKQELSDRPNDHSIYHSLALLYEQITRYREALDYMNKVLNSRTFVIDRRLRASYLITRSTILKILDKPEEGLRDLAEAQSLLPESEFTLNLRIAFAAVEFFPQGNEHKAFVERAKELMLKALTEVDFSEEASRAVTLLNQLCTRFLREGATERARSILQPAWERLQKLPVEVAWQLRHLMGWLSYELGEYQEAWPHLKAAMVEVEESLPDASDIEFAPFWLQDKESFQSNLATIALDLVRRGTIADEELLSVYEFMNGREITERLMNLDENRISIDTLADRYRRRIGRIKKRVVTFFFVESKDKINLVNISAAGEVSLNTDLDLPLQEVVRIKEQTQTAFKWANPTDQSALESGLREWNKLGRRLGEALQPYLVNCEHACFLPGRTFSSLPLHLIETPDGRRLIEGWTVSYAPNFSTLLAKPHPAESTGGTTIVTITKEHDSDSFKKAAHAASARLQSNLGVTKVKMLKEQEADRTAVMQSLEDSSEIIFICHGTTAGPERGYGICIADAGELPPTLLPISELPELARFMLVWQDINGLSRTPVTVVSIACSSGITQVGGGGVRFGLEQTLFATGTQVIISPLWDVNQPAALAWLEQLFLSRSEHPNWTIEKSIQQTSLLVSKQFPHPYFWGAFALNGSVLQEAL